MSKHAILMVHGIGDFAAGHALAAGTQSLQKRFPNLEASEETQDECGLTRFRDFHSDAGTVRLSEYHWSGAFGKLRRLNPLHTLWQIFGLFHALPSLGAFGSKQALQRRLAVFGGGTLRLLAIALTVGIILQFVEQVAKDRAWAIANPALEYWTLDMPIVLAMVLVVVTVAGGVMYMLSLGASGRQSGRATQWLGFLVGLVLLIAYAAIIFYALLFLWLLFFQTDSLGMIVSLLLLLGPPFVLAVWLLLTVVDLLRDVVTYLAPGEDGSDNVATTSIKQEVVGALDRLVADGFDEITLVAHSLGTVIAVEVLLNWAPQADVQMRVRLITCGSPLRRLIAPLLPNRCVEPRDVFSRLATRDAFHLIGWQNFYRVLDPVGQRLFHGATLASGDGPQQQDGLLKPWYIAPYGHSNYWGDPRFLENILKTTRNVSGQSKPLSG